MSLGEVNYSSSHFRNSMNEVGRHAISLTAETKAIPEAYDDDKAYVKM